jgi:hypothetical protein
MLGARHYYIAYTPNTSTQAGGVKTWHENIYIYIYICSYFSTHLATIAYLSFSITLVENYQLSPEGILPIPVNPIAL